MLANIIRNRKKTGIGGGGGGIVIDNGDPFYSAVSMLLPMDGTNGSTTFTDSGPNAIAVTNVGSPTTSTTQLKFGTSAAAVGGTNYLTLPNNSSLFDFGLGDFTIEFWFYYSSSQSGQIQIFARSANQSGSLSPIFIEKKSGINYIGLSWTSDGTNWVLNAKSGTVAMTPNAWNHVAIVRRSGIFYSYINGVQDWSDSTSSTSAIQAGGDVLAIGRWPKYANSPGTYYIDDFRISLFARYTSTFTPPAAALPTTASSTPADPYYGYTSLLLHMDGTNASTAFVDSGPNALTVTAAANAQISTTQVKYGSASGYFDGTGDSLTIPANTALALGAGDYTIEGWFYSLTSGTSLRGMIDFRTAATGTNGLMLRENDGGFLVYLNNATILSTTTGRVANQWQHVALVRKGTAVTLYVDGVSRATATSSTTLTDNVLRISGFVDTQSNLYTYNGYIDDLRITKYARFTSAFTPPSQAHPNA